MSRAAVARTYAETLLELAGPDAGGKWFEMLSEVTGLYGTSATFKAFLHTPRVSDADRQSVLRAAFDDRYPELLVRFLLVVVQKRRQGLFPEIETAVRDLLYERTGRLYATVTMTAHPDAEFAREIEGHLSRILERKVDADFRVDARLVGGMVVRAQDKVLDGSIRRRLQTLRRRLLEHGSTLEAASKG